MHVGFIGLGHMGSHMARNLLHGNISLTVHGLNQEAAAEHCVLGARWADTAAQCAAEAEVLITMLPTPASIETVMLHAQAAAALPAGSLWIDMSTSTPHQAQRIRDEVLTARGVNTLDAPVSGMAKGAAAGMLQIFVGGHESDYRRALPLFEIMGDPARIMHVGGLGTGYAVKLMINLLWFEQVVASSEILAMGLRAGVELGTLRQALLASPAATHFLSSDILYVLEHGDYDDSFAMILACKDLGLAVDLGRQLGVPTELAALVEQIYRRAKAIYGDHAGEMSPIRLYEALIDRPFRLAAATAEPQTV